MPKNRIVLLAGLLVLLTGIAYLAGVFDTAPSTISVPEVEIPTDALTALTVRASDWEGTLAQDGGVWRVTDPVSSRADSLTVKRLLDSVADLQLNSVVSTNPARHENYGVDQESGQYVTMRWNGGEATLVVAAQGPDFSSSYVRLEEDPRVYSSSRVALPTTLAQLRDKTLINVDPASVTAARVITPEESFEVNLDGGSWQLTRGEGTTAADSVKVTGWIRRFAPLRFDAFRDSLTPDSVVVTHSVAFTLTGGSTLQVSLGQTGEDLLAFASGQPAVMRAMPTRLGVLFQPASSLLP